MDVDPTLIVDEDSQVYRPSDDSYLLLEALSVAPGERFLEVGTGTGLVALHAARTASVVATDVNVDALRLARRNARRNALSLTLVRMDLMAGLRGPFEVVAFNPPYLRGSPKDALDRAWSGGREGSDVVRRFLDDLPRLLSAQGRAYLLLSDANESARAMAADRFRTRVMASKALFFERLEVLELRAQGPRDVTRGRPSRASRISKSS